MAIFAYDTDEAFDPQVWLIVAVFWAYSEAQEVCVL